jgi:GNAT superfamily N-acetyltransferase
MIEIVNAETLQQISEARKLFRDYEKWFGIDLSFQDFDGEVANLPEKYALPDGRLLLAFVDGKLAGGVGLRKLEDEICEMKRLFVREDFRALGLGKKLIEKLIEEARLIGYKKLRLDTYPPKMSKAVKIYESYGFRVIDSYYYNPYEQSLFMEKDLS